jgi:N-acyl-D-glutamate deacylase
MSGNMRAGFRALVVTVVVVTAVLVFTVGAIAQSSTRYDLVISGGRVIDPETKLDAVRHIGINGTKIATVSEQPLNGQKVINAQGLIVAPGFIDYHGHGQSIPADRMQAFDGVTTTMELESGILPIAAWYDAQAENGRVLNYGASAAWINARIAALEGKTPEPNLAWLQSAFSLSDWVNNVSTAEQQAQILAQIEQGLKEGGIGIGINSGYVPGYGYKEVLAVHQLAAKYQVPTYTHIRNFSNIDPSSSVQAYGEVISFATTTGSHAHICHLNSTSARDISLAAEMIRGAQERGAKVTVEAYPFSAASTAIGSAFLSPENLPRMGMSIADIEYKGQPLTEERYLDLRQNSPGEPVVFHFLRLPRDQELLDESVLFPGGIIASDALPWVDTATNQEITGGHLAATQHCLCPPPLYSHLHDISDAMGTGSAGRKLDGCDRPQFLSTRKTA